MPKIKLKKNISKGLHFIAVAVDTVAVMTLIK